MTVIRQIWRFSRLNLNFRRDFFFFCYRFAIHQRFEFRRYYRDSRYCNAFNNPIKTVRLRYCVVSVLPGPRTYKTCVSTSVSIRDNDRPSRETFAFPVYTIDTFESISGNKSLYAVHAKIYLILRCFACDVFGRGRCTALLKQDYFSRRTRTVDRTTSCPSSFFVPGDTRKRHFRPAVRPEIKREVVVVGVGDGDRQRFPMMEIRSIRIAYRGVSPLPLITFRNRRCY